VATKLKELERLVSGVKHAGAIRRGRAPAARVTELKPEDVRATRLALGKSQEEFPLMIGVSVATLQNWEQGRRRPDAPARALLRVAAKNPRAVADALASQRYDFVRSASDFLVCETCANFPKQGHTRKNSADDGHRVSP